MQCEMEFVKLDQQTDYVKKVEPLIYTGKLWVGILCIFLTANQLAVILLDNIFGYVPGMAPELLRDATDYVDDLMGYLVRKDQVDLCNVIFVSMTVYLLVTTVKGNSFLGFRFASPLFYPMRKNET
jgi:hypothetical protein